MKNELAINTKTLDIELDSGVITISKLPLKKYADLLLKLDELPKQLNALSDTSDSELLKVIPKIVAASLGEVINILEIGTNLTKEEVEELALDEVVKLLIGIMKVNKYLEVYEELKKLFARPTPVKE